MKEKEQPIQDEYRDRMQVVGRIIDAAFNDPKKPKQTGFALFIFPFGQGDDHRSNYISNASRKDMIATLKEFIAKNEGTYEEPTSKKQ